MSEVAIPLVLLIGWTAAMLWHALSEDRRQAALEIAGSGGVAGESPSITPPVAPVDESAAQHD